MSPVEPEKRFQQEATLDDDLGEILQTGCGNLQLGAAVRGYRLILTMPDAMSVERVALLRQFGAEVVLTPGILMTDAVSRAEALAQTMSGALRLDQFRNPANPETHRRTTAVEILEDTDGAVDAFVSAVGTGGTITGVGEMLKQCHPEAKVIAVEPFATARRLARTEGILAGASSGAAMHAALQIAARTEYQDRTILVLLADTGERYIATPLFEH